MSSVPLPFPFVLWSHKNTPHEISTNGNYGCFFSFLSIQSKNEIFTRKIRDNLMLETLKIVRLFFNQNWKLMKLFHFSCWRISKKGEVFFLSYRLYDAVSLKKLLVCQRWTKNHAHLDNIWMRKSEVWSTGKSTNAKVLTIHNILKSCTVETLCIENHTSDEMLYSSNLRIAWGEMKDSATIQIDMFTIQRALTINFTWCCSSCLRSGSCSYSHFVVLHWPKRFEYLFSDIRQIQSKCASDAHCVNI